MKIPRGAVSDNELQRGYPLNSGARTYSRRHNPVEASKAFQKLESQQEDAIERVHERSAKRFLKYFRKLLKRHNYSRHVITVSASMGMCTVDVDGEWVRNKPPYGAYLLLQEIDQAMNYDYAHYLDGERLN